MQKSAHKIVIILGPTASGKSNLAVQIAKKFNGEVISADSRQVYNGLNIGTGKITKREMRGIPHHLLDVADPRKQFSVAEYQKFGEIAVQKILKKSKFPIICGGTGLYIDALIYGYTLPHVPPNPKLRQKLEKESAEVLFAELKKLDPRRAKNIDRNNRRRLVRALEIVLATGKPVPPSRESLKKISNYDALRIGILFPNEVLRERIRRRLIARIKQGMIQEVKRLHARGLSWKRMEELGLEYRYISRHLRGMLSRKEMIEKLNAEIWHYAKRQMTWFKRDKKIHWVSSPREAEKLVRNFLG